MEGGGLTRTRGRWSWCLLMGAGGDGMMTIRMGRVKAGREARSMGSRSKYYWRRALCGSLAVHRYERRGT